LTITIITHNIAKLSLIQQNSAALKKAEEAEAVAQNELHELWNMVDVCPICGQSIQKGVSG
jgi:hypothetical protein